MLVHRLKMYFHGVENERETCSALDSVVKAILESGEFPLERDTRVVIVRSQVDVFQFIGGFSRRISMDIDSVADVETCVQNDFHLPEIRMTVGKQRHFNYIHDRRLRSKEHRNSLFLTVIAELVAFLSEEQTGLESEIGHIPEHLSVTRVEHSHIIGHENHILLGNLRLKQRPAHPHAILETNHTVVVDSSALLHVIPVYDIVRERIHAEVRRREGIDVYVEVLCAKFRPEQKNNSQRYDM